MNLMRTGDAAVLATIQSKSESAVKDLLDDSVDVPVALLDVPTHMNVGDSMIYSGERALLRRIGVGVGYQADRWRYDPRVLRAEVGRGPILLHGGGNFGDDWPDFQHFREEVVARHRDAQIIQLPQSVSFRDPKAAAKANAALASHPNFTLLVRESQSLGRAQEQLPDVLVKQVPDMAFSMALPAVTVEPLNEEPVVLARRDHETTGWLAGAAVGLFPDARVVDWGLSGMDRARWYCRKLPAIAYTWAPRSVRTRVLERSVQSHYEPLLGQNIRAGVRVIGNAQPLVTDRLHAHVLAILLGRPNIVTDNANGKISAMMRDYTGEFSTAQFVEDERELAAAIGAMRNG